MPDLVDNRINVSGIVNISGRHLHRRRKLHKILDRLNLGQLAEHFQIITGDVYGVVDGAELVHTVDGVQITRYSCILKRTYSGRRI